MDVGRAFSGGAHPERPGSEAIITPRVSSYWADYVGAWRPGSIPVAGNLWAREPKFAQAVPTRHP